MEAQEKKTYKVTRKQLNLTSKQQEYMQMLANGLTAEEVAEHFGVSSRTIEGSVKHVMAFTKAKNRTHAVAICLRKKYIK